MADMKATLLEVWVDGDVHGICRVPIGSIAARPILKFFDPSRRAEFRDSETDLVYRYDPGKNIVHCREQPFS